MYDIIDGSCEYDFVDVLYMIVSGVEVIDHH